MASLPDWTDIAPALVGLAGVLFGSAASWSASIRVQRTQFNIARIEAATNYATMALRCADFLYLAHANDVDALRNFLEKIKRDFAANPRADLPTTYQRDDELRERVALATREWRVALTTHYLTVRDPLAAELVKFDHARSKAAEHSNQGQVSQYMIAVEDEMSKALLNLKLAANIEAARMNLVLERSMRLGVTWIGDCHRTRKAYAEAVKRYEDSALAD